jgi:hypothetical protein
MQVGERNGRKGQFVGHPGLRPNPTFRGFYTLPGLTELKSGYVLGVTDVERVGRDRQTISRAAVQ